MARKATWQRHADPRSAPTWRVHTLYIFIIYISINGSLSSPIWGGSYSYKRSGIIYPTVSINKVRVGLIFFSLLTLQATWRSAERWIWRAIDRRTSIAWSADHRIEDHSTCVNRGVITATIRSRGSHLSRPIAIQGAEIKRFYNAYWRDDLGPPSVIQRSRYFLKTVHHGPLS